jgi:hypothetical protein
VFRTEGLCRLAAEPKIGSETCRMARITVVCATDARLFCRFTGVAERIARPKYGGDARCYTDFLVYIET